MIYPRYKIYNKKVFKNFFDKKISEENLERKFSAYTTLKNIIPLNFARTGLFYIIKKIIKKDKNEILISPFTIFDIINVIISAGGNPKFVDTEPDEPYISKKKINEHLTANTAGILITHYHNTNPEIENIAEYCKLKNIKLIEDCAISLGGKYYRSLDHVGKKADYAIFSFGIFKTISSISGGILYIKNLKEFEEIKKNIQHQKKISCFDFFMKVKNKLKYQIILDNFFFKNLIFPIIKFSEIFNIKYLSKFLKNDPKPRKNNKIPNHYLNKISEYQVSQIFTQINDLELRIKSRVANAKFIHNLLINNDCLILPRINDKCDTFHTFPVIVKNSQKKNLYNYLLRNNFDVSKYYYRNCSSLKEFREFGDLCVNCEFYANNVICIPCYPGIQKEYLKNLCNLINQFQNVLRN